MKLTHNLTALVAGLGLVGATQAENFMRGVRGPTDWQFDTRVSLSQRELNDKETTTFTDTTSVRYWNGGSKGIFAYIVAPYKLIDAGTRQSSGLGDASIGIGPRGALTNSLGSFHYISTVGLILPTGNDQTTPKLGNGRTDLRFSLGGTYLTPSKKTEIDASFDYLRAEKDASDDILFGLAAGHQVHPNVKIGGGILGTIKHEGPQDGNYLFTGRAIIRYTPSKPEQKEDLWKRNWHTELWLDYDITSKKSPQGFASTLVFRYNF